LSTYTLDFETIQQVMQEHRKTGLLYAEIPSGVVKLRESCRVEIKIVTGAIASCAIVGVSGRRLIGKDATHELARLGRIRWTFTAQQEATTPSQATSSGPLPGVPATFPRQYTYLSQAQMRTWPRLHRAVFALADGTKSIIKIAEILSVPPDLVEKTLRELQSIGVIIMEPGDRRNNGRYT
jgi:hypothetical protein